MSEALEIFGKVSQYLAHQINLNELEDWIVPRLALFLTLPPCAASALAGTIELGLAEIGAGQITEEEFRTMLAHEVHAPAFEVWGIGQKHHSLSFAVTSSHTHPIARVKLGADRSSSWSTSVEVVSS